MSRTSVLVARRLRLLAGGAGVLLLLGIATGTGQAIAATPAPAVTGDAGWIRLAHLSPDTAAVDVQLSALEGGAVVFEVDAVGYGVVSDYITVAPGAYLVSMAPTGSTEPVVSATVQIEKDEAVTFAAFGANSALQTRVFQDDLDAPDAGAARIRLIQASTVTDIVDVTTTTGIVIASQARAGDATTYATVPAGPWDIALTAFGIDDVASISLQDGSVNTLFVLDNSSGGLTVLPVLDSAGVGATPVGGVQTGGGALGSAFAALVEVAPAG